MIPKRQPYRNKKIREAARDEACTLQGPNCTGGGEDTESFNTSQMAEYLTEFQRHYWQYVNLTDPQERGLLEAEK